MNRRDFLKIVGITTATSTAALYGCGSKEGSSEGSKVLGPIPTDKMTYRSFPGLGSDKVSILSLIHILLNEKINEKINAKIGN